MAQDWLKMGEPIVCTWAKAKNGIVPATSITITLTLTLWCNEGGVATGLGSPGPGIPQ